MLRQFVPKNPVSYTLIELGPPHDFELSAIQVEGQVSFTDCVPNELAHTHCFPSWIPEYLQKGYDLLNSLIHVNHVFIYLYCSCLHWVKQLVGESAADGLFIIKFKSLGLLFIPWNW